ncbi:amidase [Sphingomonas sp. LH128]|uniref:amidase family protein n=1 Tax=Sphingomonas sp. LH128 TaxID=473781 RepID=UPI00027CBF07|nr:amidase family protein [Sphingomonas sp. LH128]EJU14979.1 amidase [Sphingomonas sp. LH128]
MTADWHERSIAELGAAMAAGRLTSVALCDHFLDRIARLDRAGPMLNSVREENPEARAIARALDAERAAGAVRGPLHGIPVLLKDNIATGDGMATTAGSLALAGLRPLRDAGIVRRLRAAGAVILGKCNMTEFADYLADTMPSEYSSAGGVVRHPHGLRYDRGGGSSVGPACAVAAGLAVFAIGSETQNSIQTPASQSAVVGLKPTVGLVSRAGIVPLVTSQDTAGPLTRSVADAAVVLAAIAGADFGDSATLDAATHAADYGRFPDASALAGARIGVARRVYFGRPGQAAADAVADAALVVARVHGAMVIDPADVPTADAVAALRSTVFPSAFKAGLNAFLEAQGPAAPCANLAAILAFNAANPEACLRYGQALAEAAEGSAGIDAPVYRADRQRDVLLSRTLGIEAVCQHYGLDALLVPGGAAAKLTGKAGCPVLTVPAGWGDDGWPAGISLIGPAFSEPRLLAIGHALEQALAAEARAGGRPEPRRRAPD